MSKTRKLTICFIIACVLIIIAYDIWAVYSGGIPGTISSVIFDYSHKFPLIPFLFGALSAHFFWPVYPPKEKQ